MNSKNLLLLISRIAIPACILYYIFINIPVSEVISVISTSTSGIVLPAMVIYTIIHIISGYRLKIVAFNQDISITTFQAVEINLSKIFYGLFLPGGSLTGGTVRFYKLFGKQRNISGSLAVITLDGVVSIITLCLVGSVMWTIHMPPDMEFFLFTILSILAACIILILILFQDKIKVLYKLKMKILRLWLLPQKFKQIINTLTEYKNVNLNIFITIIILSIITQLMGISVYYLFAHSLDIDLSFATIGWIRTLVVIATMLPVSISGIGVREGMFIYLLSQYGVSAEQSLALSFLVFVFTVLIMGLFSGLLEGRRFFLSPIKDN